MRRTRKKTIKWPFLLEAWLIFKGHEALIFSWCIFDWVFDFFIYSNTYFRSSDYSKLPFPSKRRSFYESSKSQRRVLFSLRRTQRNQLHRERIIKRVFPKANAKMHWLEQWGSAEDYLPEEDERRHEREERPRNNQATPNLKQLGSHLFIAQQGRETKNWNFESKLRPQKSIMISVTVTCSKIF